jgi:HNH endonuclease
VGRVTDGWLRHHDSTLSPRRLVVQVWFDKSLDGEKPGYWAGFGAQTREPVEKIVSDCSPTMLPSRTLEENDWEMRRNIFCLKNRPTDIELQLPIQEHYGQYNGFGIYGRPLEPFDAGKATMFIESVIRSLPEYNLPDDYSAFENRKVVGWHLRAERDPNLARMCKVRDGHKCQVCGFHFETEYGPLGEDFAEAHHIVPLSTLDGEVRTSLDGLVTVCANCHRMLHRMDGDKDDINNLRRMLKIP